MPEQPYRIIIEHGGERYSWCGFAGRFWFARLPNLASVTFASRGLAAEYAAKMPDNFDRYVIDPGAPGERYLDPKHTTLLID